jgi:5-methylcytosine-specific restriction endonuclease McrA
MAILAPVESWKTTTPGEEVFLLNYVRVSTAIPADILTEQSWIVNAQGWVEFLRLTAAMELTHRCIATGAELLSEVPEATTNNVLHRLSMLIGLPRSGTESMRLAQSTLFAARNSMLSSTPNGVSQAVYRQWGPKCCWCGRHTSSSASGGNTLRSLEHIWPRNLGGSSVEENLAVACAKCNSKRGHAFTWAWFPVQAMWNERRLATADRTESMDYALALHRIMKVASGRTQYSAAKTTLKGAAQILKASIPSVPSVAPAKRLTFFELLDTASE